MIPERGEGYGQTGYWTGRFAVSHAISQHLQCYPRDSPLRRSHASHTQWLRNCTRPVIPKCFPSDGPHCTALSKGSAMNIATSLAC